jgi:hypothetical protein
MKIFTTCFIGVLVPDVEACGLGVTALAAGASATMIKKITMTKDRKRFMHAAIGLIE